MTWPLKKQGDTASIPLHVVVYNCNGTQFAYACANVAERDAFTTEMREAYPHMTMWYYPLMRTVPGLPVLSFTLDPE